jgi:hypothetical protein
MPNDQPLPSAVVVVTPRADEPPVVLEPFTCPWAMDGLRRAMEGMGTATAGVSEYHIGTRGLKYTDAAKQIGMVGWWNEMVKLFCGIDGLPSVATGRDTAFRVIPRDV